MRQPQLMDELVNGAVTRTYAYGLHRISEDQQLSSTWTPSFYGYDGHGNVRFLTNNAGAITDSYTYDAFGMPITTSGTTPNNFLYSGEQFDSAVGAYYLRARYFNPATGRFLTMDPYAGTILDPATLHKYVYAKNNPVNATDPTGRDALLEGVYLDLARPSPVTIGLFRSALWGCYAVAAWDIASLVPGVEEPPQPLGKICSAAALAFPPGIPVPWDPFAK